jgi:hypothetical protein
MCDVLCQVKWVICRSWIKRRVVWTIDYIFIARVGEEVVIDFIPLSEADTITCSEELNKRHESEEKVGVKGKGFEKEQGANNSRRIFPEDAIDVTNKKTKYSKLKHIASRTGSGFLQDSRIDDTKPTKGKNVLKITTTPDGFNSGVH